MGLSLIHISEPTIGAVDDTTVSAAENHVGAMPCSDGPAGQVVLTNPDDGYRD